MHPMDHRPSLPVIGHIVFPDIVLVWLVATHPPFILRLLGFSIFSYLTFSSLAYTAGNPTQDYFIGFVLSSQFLLAVWLIWIIVPLDELSHERDTVRPREMPLLRRLYWAFCLDHSVRAIGWSYQVSLRRLTW